LRSSTLHARRFAVYGGWTPVRRPSPAGGRRHRPLAAVSAATIAIAVPLPRASATEPARSAPATKPVSRQKRETPTTEARSRGSTTSELRRSRSGRRAPCRDRAGPRPRVQTQTPRRRRRAGRARRPGPASLTRAAGERGGGDAEVPGGLVQPERETPPGRACQ